MKQNIVYISKYFYLTLLVVIVLFGATTDYGILTSAKANTLDKSVNTVAGSFVTVLSSDEINEYLTTKILLLSGFSDQVEMNIINGPSSPPSGFDIERTSATLSVSDSEAGAKILTVPAFDWVFGCSSVSAAMIAGYYDRNNYPNMYTGPTNDGVMPLDNSSWPTWSDGSVTYPNLPLAASHQGVDGRVDAGSIDDYWTKAGDTADDPYIINDSTEHVWGDAIGDYMKTSQSAYGNSDGATAFYSSPPRGVLTCADMLSSGMSDSDGTYGRKLFYEARGYTVTECYSQKTDNNTRSEGFTFTQFVEEIDAGRPVMLNLDGHTIVGVGYDDSDNTIYIHDTWDYDTHEMTWGGSYFGMELLSVSIVNLAEEDVTLTGLTINGATSVDENSTASYTVTAGWSDNTFSTVIPTWSEDSSYTTMSTDGILSTSAVSADETVAISAGYTSGGITKTDTFTVTVEAGSAFPWVLFAPVLFNNIDL